MPQPGWRDSTAASASNLLPVDDPAVTTVPAPPVGHLMPGWEPLLSPLPPVEPAAKIPVGSRPRSRAARPERLQNQPTSIKRAFADPFKADDTGTNCIRCGYLVSPFREKRGYTTCVQCQ